MAKQMIRQSVVWTIAVVFALLFSGCGGSRSAEPRATVDDPRAYAIEALQTMDLNAWWQAYRNPDPVLLGQIVDDVAEALPDGLPMDQRNLGRLIGTRIATKYRLQMTDTDEGKAYILEQAENRSADPPMALWDDSDEYALLDYHVLLGEWKSTKAASGYCGVASVF